MIAAATINLKLEKIREYLKLLQTLQKIPLEVFLKDFIVQGAVLRYLQIVIECAIDVADVLISERRWSRPRESKETFLLLLQKQVLPESLARRLAEAARFRNFIVHEYDRINLDLVYKHLQEDIADIDSFAKVIAEFLVKNR